MLADGCPLCNGSTSSSYRPIENEWTLYVLIEVVQCTQEREPITIYILIQIIHKLVKRSINLEEPCSHTKNQFLEPCTGLSFFIALNAFDPA